jgi:hypothetical protein
MGKQTFGLEPYVSHLGGMGASHKERSSMAEAGDNSLADLAARIRAEHEAVSTALKESVRHAIAAGELLIEAKGQLGHGRWLPWLRDHCTISERTAQLYMRVAKSRAEVENQMRNDVADLTLNEAAALLALSSDVRKLLAFVKECEGREGEELVQACLDAGVALISTPGYDMFAGQSDEQRREWKLFAMWLTKQGHRNAAYHVEWLMRTGDGGVAKWLGEEGDRYRARWGMRQMPEAFKAEWSAFLAERRSLTEVEIEAELEAAHSAAPVMLVPTRKGRRK